MKILRTTDRVRIKIGEIALIVSPLKQSQKIEFSSLVKRVEDGKEVPDIQGRISYVVKSCVKGIEGVTDFEDKPIQVTIDEATGELTDDSHSEIMTVLNGSIGHIASMFSVANGNIPGEITDIITGKKIKGAEVVVNPKP